MDLLGDLLKKAGIYTDFLKSRIDEVRQNKEAEAAAGDKRKGGAKSSPKSKKAKTEKKFLDVADTTREVDPRQPKLITG